MTIVELIFRLIIAFITLLILVRIIGRKELSEMTFFNFVSGISIGTIGATLAVNSSLSIRNGFIALLVWSAFTIIIGILDIKSSKARNAIGGQPMIVIKKGKMMEDELRKARLDIDALSSLLRKKNVFGFSEVDYAIYETDGTLSVMKKEMKQPLTKNDMNITPANNTVPMPTIVISDGKIKKRNLENLNLDQQWVEQQLTSAGIDSITHVFLAEVQKNGSLYIDERKDIDYLTN